MKLVNGRLVDLDDDDLAQRAADDARFQDWVADRDRREAERLLRRSDAEMARVVEDLVDVLVAKGVIALADLPQPAQDRINQRKNLRGQL